MKTTILLFFALLISCSKDSSTADQIAQLPAATTVGANTFGCIINNQVFYPRDGVGNFGGSSPSKGFVFWGDPSGNQEFNEIEIDNFKDAKPVNLMYIHLQGLHQNGLGDYLWHISNFHNSIDGLMQNYIYAKIYDASVNGWMYYGSYENSGKVTITRYDTINYIVSGTFSGKLRLMNGTQEIDILNGRFDINKTTLNMTVFP